MTALRSIKRGFCWATVVGVLAAVAGASPAHAESAWWGLTSGARPTYLKPGVSGQSEVQQLTASLSGPEFKFSLSVEGSVVGKFWSRSNTFGWEPATAANIQKALEKPTVYGPGNVEVTGGPPGTAPLVVTSVRDEADKVVAPLEVQAEAGSAAAAILTPGRSSGDVVVATATNLGDAPLTGSATPVTITDTLPPGVTAEDGIVAYTKGTDQQNLPLSCSASSVSCTWSSALGPYEYIEMYIPVDVAAGAESGENLVSVSGGQTGECKEVATGAGQFLDNLCLVTPSFGEQSKTAFELEPVAGTTVQPRSLRRPLTVSAQPPPFSIEQYEMQAEQEGGAPTAQGQPSVPAHDDRAVQRAGGNARTRTRSVWRACQPRRAARDAEGPHVQAAAWANRQPHGFPAVQRPAVQDSPEGPGRP